MVDTAGSGELWACGQLDAYIKVGRSPTTFHDCWLPCSIIVKKNHRLPSSATVLPAAARTREGEIVREISRSGESTAGIRRLFFMRRIRFRGKVVKITRQQITN
jgi:hypothetical protein